jgi:putative two-component system response regulator
LLKRLKWRLPDLYPELEGEVAAPVFIPWKLELNRSLRRTIVPAEAERVANFELLARLAVAAEAHDLTTARHLENIQCYARMLAAALDCDATFIEELEVASIMHDVGKIGVPKTLLTHTTTLDDEAWIVMRQHPIIGEKLLSRPGLEMAREVARGHHERWDGRGYPDGRSGTDTPLSARIVAVVDAYDAMTSKRPYKLAWSPRQALSEISSLAGSQFDPQIVDAFMDAFSAESLAGVVAS